MLIGVPVFAVIYDLIHKLVKRGLIRNNKTELLDEEDRKAVEKKSARLSPGEHLEQKLDERILRRELEAMDKAKEEEEKEKNLPKEDVTEDDIKKRRLKDKIKKQKRGEKNGTV